MPTSSQTFYAGITIVQLTLLWVLYNSLHSVSIPDGQIRILVSNKTEQMTLIPVPIEPAQNTKERQEEVKHVAIIGDCKGLSVDKHLSALVLMSDDRCDPLDAHFALTTVINWDYCRKYNYSFEAHCRKVRGPPWCKLQSMQRAMEQSKYSYDFYLWLDSDAIFSSHNTSLAQFLDEIVPGDNREDTILMVPDDNWNDRGKTGCAGILLFNTTTKEKKAKAKDLLIAWWNAPGFQTNTKHPPYEQFVLNKYLLSDTRWKRHVYILQVETFWDRQGQYFRHFTKGYGSANNHKHRLDSLRNFMRTKLPCLDYFSGLKAVQEIIVNF